MYVWTLCRTWFTTQPMLLYAVASVYLTNTRRNQTFLSITRKHVGNLKLFVTDRYRYAILSFSINLIPRIIALSFRIIVSHNRSPLVANTSVPFLYLESAESIMQSVSNVRAVVLHLRCDIDLAVEMMNSYNLKSCDGFVHGYRQWQGLTNYQS